MILDVEMDFKAIDFCVKILEEPSTNVRVDLKMVDCKVDHFNEVNLDFRNFIMSKVSNEEVNKVLNLEINYYFKDLMLIIKVGIKIIGNFGISILEIGKVMFEIMWNISEIWKVEEEIFIVICYYHFVVIYVGSLGLV